MNIQHDFHIHTTLSLCADETATVENYLSVGKKLGLKKIGFSDHFWDSSIAGANGFYQPQDYDHICKLKSKLVSADKSDLLVYFGCETEYDPYHHGVAITEKVAEQLDFILVPNSHTHMVMPKSCYQPYQKHVDFMVTAYEEIINSNVSRYITAMAHPFEAVCCPYDNSILINMISDDCFKRIFDKTAEKGIAIEINVASMHNKTKAEIEQSPQIRMFKLAKDVGCKFIFGSDAHDNQKHSSYSNAGFVADLLELEEKDITPIARCL